MSGKLVQCKVSPQAGESHASSAPEKHLKQIADELHDRGIDGAPDRGYSCSVPSGFTTYQTPPTPCPVTSPGFASAAYV